MYHSACDETLVHTLLLGPHNHLEEQANYTLFPLRLRGIMGPGEQTTFWSGTQCLPHPRLCFSLIYNISCNSQEAELLMPLSLSCHGHCVVTSVSSPSGSGYSFAVKELPWLAGSLLKADMLTAEGDRMKETAQTLHTLQHEGQQSLPSKFSWRGKPHTLPPRNEKGLGPSVSLVDVFSMAEKISTRSNHSQAF